MAKAANTKAPTSGKAPTKSQILNELAEKTGLKRKDVAAVFDALGGVIKRNLNKRGPGQVTIPGLVKLVRKDKKAQPAGPRKNPFTGEVKMMPAKPASSTVRARPLKALKDMV